MTRVIFKIVDSRWSGPLKVLFIWYLSWYSTSSLKYYKYLQLFDTSWDFKIVIDILCLVAQITEIFAFPMQYIPTALCIEIFMWKEVYLLCFRI